MPARQAAVAALHAVLTLGRGLEEALAPARARLAPSDRALAHALAGGALRWLVDLDRLIDSACHRPLPPDSRARQVLRVALSGRLLLATPMHAVIATALPLLDGGPRRLAHAVLGQLDRAGASLPASPHLPPSWAGRWLAAHGEVFVATARESLGTVPPTDLSLKDAAATADWAARLGGTSLEPGHVRLDGAPPLADLPGFDEGAFWAQDLAARQPVRLLGDVRGRRVLDLCAAPGGKTMQLAAAGALVTAVDSDGRRLRRLAANLARTGLVASLVEADAQSFGSDAPFDAVLLDAPCTATGTFRRHPEVLHRRSPADVRACAPLQRRLLAHAAGLVATGGRLVYAVCSIEPEEGAMQFERAGDLSLDLLAQQLLLPGAGLGDGFAIAAFTRAG